MAEKWTKTSALPSDGAMNPNPLSALNHLTVPCAILAFLPGGAPTPRRRGRAAAVLPGRKRCLPRGHLAKRVLRPSSTVSQIAVQLTFLLQKPEKCVLVSRASP